MNRIIRPALSSSSSLLRAGRIIRPVLLSTPKAFISSTPTKMSQPFLDAIHKRRTFYSIAPELPAGVTEARIEEIIKQIFLDVPSSFNNQSSRAVILFQKEHEKVWTFAHEILKGIVPAEAFAATEQKLNGFKSGYGTILFFEDSIPVKKLQDGFPLYAERFPTWSEHTSAMHQFAIWTALEAEGLGASLQHYNPLIDAKVKAEFKVPETWQLIAQMPFGKPTAAPGPKEHQPLEDRVKIFGKSQ